MCASASSTLRFSSTITRTLSTPEAGEAVLAAEAGLSAVCVEPKVGLGTDLAAAPLHPVSPTEIAMINAADPRRHRAACRRALLKGTTFSSCFAPASLLLKEPVSVNDAYLW